MDVKHMLLAALGVAAKTLDTATPPMGWNSYNHYACSPSEAAIRSNAQGLVDTGLADKGYTYVTTDCGCRAGTAGPTASCSGTRRCSPRAAGASASTCTAWACASASTRAGGTSSADPRTCPRR